MNLSQLIAAIHSTHEFTQRYAHQQVNSTLSIRNWITGFYLYHFEQNGEDRAVYGERLYKTIAEKLKMKSLKGFSFTALHQYRQFYLTYPQFIQAVSEQFPKMNASIIQTLSEQLQCAVNEDNTNWWTVSAIFSAILPKTNDRLLILEDSGFSSPPSKFEGLFFLPILKFSRQCQENWKPIQPNKPNLTARPNLNLKNRMIPLLLIKSFDKFGFTKKILNHNRHSSTHSH